jgi:hypothetical protein|tara:strand:+ start:25 stop:600 length:576 start_codon:yes stop_codon:yes gene_type:complete
MAIYNTPSDAANTAVRSFLTKLGEEYYQKSFNTGSGQGKEVWRIIREEEFDGCCAYCGGKTDKASIEHLIMFNRDQCGLHHPGNIAPCCKTCNTRSKTEDKHFQDWETHLGTVVETNGGSISDLNTRKNRIKTHMDKWRYPKLSSDELNAIRALARSLYEGIQSEVSKSVSLYQELDRTLIQGRGTKTEAN